MKLMVEHVDFESIQVIQESVDGVEKSFKIRGPFLEAERTNRNGRVYPIHIIEREVGKYVANRVKTKRACGELDHPPTPSLNLDRVSHLVEDLHMEGNLAIGTAKILDTPMGKIASSLLKAGVGLGVSSRGLGTLKGNIVNEDYGLLCIDIVGDPSAPSAYVDGIFENKEWIISGNTIVEAAVDQLKQKLDKSGSKVIREALSKFLSDIRGQV